MYNLFGPWTTQLGRALSQSRPSNVAKVLCKYVWNVPSLPRSLPSLHGLTAFDGLTTALSTQNVVVVDPWLHASGWSHQREPKVALISFDGQFPTQFSLSVFVFTTLFGFLAVHGSDVCVCVFFCMLACLLSILQAFQKGVNMSWVLGGCVWIQTLCSTEDEPQCLPRFYFQNIFDWQSMLGLTPACSHIRSVNIRNKNHVQKRNTQNVQRDNLLLCLRAKLVGPW